MAKTPCPSNRRQKISGEKSQKTERGKGRTNLKTLESETKGCETMKKALREWTSFREMQHIVVNYVNHVVFKTNHDADYRSQKQQVYDDICNLGALRNNLESEKNYYPISMYGSEIMRVNAMKKLAKMLYSFSMMLSHGTVPEVHKIWIRKQLKKISDHPKELLQIARRDTKCTYEWVRKSYDQNIQSEIEKRTKKQLEHLRSFPVNVSKFRASYIVDRKNEFNLVKKQISREENIQKELSSYLAAYNSTLEDLKIQKRIWCRFSPVTMDLLVHAKANYVLHAELLLMSLSYCWVE